MKASAFRRWPVAGAYSPEQTTRLTGGYDLYFRGHLDPFLFRSLLIFNIFYKFVRFECFILRIFNRSYK